MTSHGFTSFATPGHRLGAGTHPALTRALWRTRLATRHAGQRRRDRRPLPARRHPRGGAARGGRVGIGRLPLSGQRLIGRQSRLLPGPTFARRPRNHRPRSPQVVDDGTDSHRRPADLRGPATASGARFRYRDRRRPGRARDRGEPGCEAGRARQSVVQRRLIGPGAIAEMAHRHDIPVYVDEAWGPHFHFHPDLPESAMASGVDGAVASTHKVLPAFTQSAVLNVKGPRIDKGRLEHDRRHVPNHKSGGVHPRVDRCRALADGAGRSAACLAMRSNWRTMPVTRLRSIPGVDCGRR